MNLRKDHCRCHESATRGPVGYRAPGVGGRRPIRPRPPAPTKPRRHRRQGNATKQRQRRPAAHATCNPKRLSATDISALASMKNVAKCDTWCELQNPVNHRVFERKLRPKPYGRGHVCLGVTHRRHRPTPGAAEDGLPRAPPPGRPKRGPDVTTATIHGG